MADLNPTSTNNSLFASIWEKWRDVIITSNPLAIASFERCDTNTMMADLVDKLFDKYPVNDLFSRRVGKNNDISIASRETGNIHYKGKRWDSALLCFSKSVAFAEKDSLELAMAFGNRASCSIQEGFIADALIDVQRALAVPSIDDNYRVKLKYRQDVCMSRMKDTKKIPARGNLPEIPSKNNHIDNCSSKIQSKENEKLGRFLEAIDDIKTGEVLIVEKPFSSIVIPAAFYTHCSRCLFPSRVLTACPGCSVAMYCSTECLNFHKNVHRFECPILQHFVKLGVPGNHLLSIRTLIEGCLGETPINTLTKEEPVDEKYRSSDIRRVFNLKGIQRDLQSLMLVGFSSVIYVRALRMLTNFFQEFSVTESEARAFLFDSLLSLPCNSHQIGNLYLPEVGCAVYPTLSLIKHSCSNNVIQDYFGEYCIIRATKSISKGQKIMSSYGFQHLSHKKKERQALLMQIYGFQCSCQACTGDWPVFQKLPALCPKKLDRKLERKFEDICEPLSEEKGEESLKREDLDFLCFYLDYLDGLKIQRPFLGYIFCQMNIKKVLCAFPDFNRC